MLRLQLEAVEEAKVFERKDVEVEFRMAWNVENCFRITKRLKGERVWNKTEPIKKGYGRKRG